MLSIYYGTKLSPYVYKNTYKIDEIDIELKYNQMKFWYKDEIPRAINRLKKKKSPWLYIDQQVIDKKIFICEVKDAEVLETGHIVKLIGKEGKVTGRVYDATKNIMHYFTDIVMETIEDEKVIRELEEKTVEYINKLEEIYKHYFSEVDAKIEKKSFLKRLLGR